MPLSKHFRFCLWWESFLNGGHFSTCQTRKKSTPVTFFLHMRHVFLRPGVISLRRKMTPRSIFDGGHYSSLHRRTVDSVVLFFNNWVIKQVFHGYLGNSQPRSLSRGEDLGNCCPKLSQIFSTNSGQ